MQAENFAMTCDFDFRGSAPKTNRHERSGARAKAGWRGVKDR
jgi:hypothetical protein